MTTAEVQKRRRYNKGLSKKPHLTNRQKKEIKDLKQKGKGVMYIAQTIGCSISTVYNVLRSNL